LERRAELRGIFFRKGAVTIAALYFWHKFGSSIAYFSSNEIIDTTLLLAVNKSPPFDHEHTSYIPADNIFSAKITGSSTNE